MSENAGGDNAATAEVPPLSLPEEVTKATVRKTVWDYIMKNRLANFPLPVYQRIPNVKGIDEASKKLAEADFFKKASTMKSNPDKPQQTAIFHALEAKKTVLVPTPRLKTTLFTKLTPPEDADEAALINCATSLGIKEHSEKLELDQSVKIDLHLLGSVAVTKQGHRIGKGDGFFDLEYAMMRSVGAIDDSTPVVTTCHDFQVLDLPESIFSDHDVKVDYIITPTQVIKCGKQNQPKAINWSMLTEDRLNRIPVLKKLRVLEFKAGKNVNLKDEEEELTLEKLQEEADAVKDEDDSEAPNYYRRKRRYRTNYRRRPRPNSEGGDGSQEEGGDGKPEGRPRRPRFQGRRRYSGRRRRTNSGKDNEEGGSEGEKASGEEGDQERRGPPRRRRYQGRRRRGNSQTEGNSGNESAGDGESPSGGRGPPRRNNPRRFPGSRLFSIYIGGLPSSLRVKDFKRDIRDRDVNPIQVVWHGNNGHAFLVFTSQDELNAGIDKLGELTIKNKKLRVEVANRSRGKPRGGESGDGDGENTEEGGDE